MKNLKLYNKYSEKWWKIGKLKFYYNFRFKLIKIKLHILHLHKFIKYLMNKYCSVHVQLCVYISLINEILRRNITFGNVSKYYIVNMRNLMT